MLRETTPALAQPKCRPQENLRTMGNGVRADAVVPDSGVLQTGIAAAFNQRQSRIFGSYNSGLDGTSHVTMLLARKLEKDIMSRTSPR